MAQPATKTHTPPDKPLTAIEQLHHDRAGLAGELAGLNASSAKLRAAAQAEAAVLREIGEMGSAEIAAMTAWAKAGGIGDPPTPDQKHRRALAEKLAAAQVAAATAVGAGQDIDHQIGQLNQQLTTINQMTEKAALDLLEIESEEIIEQYTVAVEAENKLTAKLIGLRGYFAEEGRRLTDRGDLEAGRQYFTRANALAATKLIEHGATKAEIDAAVQDWSRRAAALRKGSPS